MIRLGLVVLFGCWMPLLVTGALHPDSNPIGFGLLAWAGTVVGFTIAALGFGLRVVRASRRDTGGG